DNPGIIPGSIIEEFEYYANGQLKTYSGNQQETWDFEYDSAGRWTRARGNTGERTDVVSRTYFPSGTIAGVVDLKNNSYGMDYTELSARTQTTDNSAAGAPYTTYG